VRGGGVTFKPQLEGGTLKLSSVLSLYTVTETIAPRSVATREDSDFKAAGIVSYEKAIEHS
jgi:hypothetical protein